MPKTRKKAKALPPLADTYLNALLFFRKGMVCFDEAGRVLEANPVAHELLDYTESDMAHRSIIDVNPYMSLLDWRKAWAFLQENGVRNEKAEFFNSKEELLPVNTFMALSDREGAPCALLFFELRSPKEKPE